MSDDGTDRIQAEIDADPDMAAMDKLARKAFLKDTDHINLHDEEMARTFYILGFSACLSVLADAVDDATLVKVWNGLGLPE